MWLDIKVHPEAKYYTCYLNGEELHDCFAANEEEEWADIHQRGSDGKIMINKEKNEAVKSRVFGKIELRKRK